MIVIFFQRRKSYFLLKIYAFFIFLFFLKKILSCGIRIVGAVILFLLYMWLKKIPTEAAHIDE